MDKFVSLEENIQSSNYYTSLVNWFRKKFMSGKTEKQFMVHPCIINGTPTLIHERGLDKLDPEAYQYLCEYAELNGYQVKEDQRADFIEGIRRVKDKNSANVISIMVITASLLLPKAFANTEDEDSHGHLKDPNQYAEVHTDHGFLSLETSLENATSENDLMVALLDWINENSSFDYTMDEMPKIEKVDEKQIVSLAFGDDLPASVNPETTRIKGLYNFHNKTVYILDSFDLNNEDDRAILLHELVHFLQFQHGDDKLFDCKRKLESFAYRLQAKYLYEHEQQIKFDGDHIRKVSQCS